MVKLKTHRNVMRRRLVEMFQEDLTELILSWHVVHHKDKNRKNNDISNLKLMTAEAHTSFHHAGRKKSKTPQEVE